MIEITEKAKNKLLELMKQESENLKVVRVSVAGGGCSGLSYKLSFDKEQKDGDQIFEKDDVKVAVDMKSYLYLHGTTLDFSDGLNGKGFQFSNPNASRTCGCGESFAV